MEDQHWPVDVFMMLSATTDKTLAICTAIVKGVAAGIQDTLPSEDGGVHAERHAEVSGLRHGRHLDGERQVVAHLGDLARRY